MFRLDLYEYFNRLQVRIGETYSPDKIIEGPWWDVVVNELNLMSYHCARRLQLETGTPYRKELSDGSLAWNEPYEEAPPTRLLAMSLILSYWLGYHDASRTHHLDTEPISAWRRIQEAYQKGKEKATTVAKSVA